MIFDCKDLIRKQIHNPGKSNPILLGAGYRNSCQPVGTNLVIAADWHLDSQAQLARDRTCN